MAESGFVIGWHKPVDLAARPDVRVSNIRARRTHVPGLGRLAKLPATVPEAAVGGTGGVVLPTPVVGRPFRPEAPRIRHVATGAVHSLAVATDGKVYGWGDGRDGQLGMAVIQEAVDLAEEVRAAVAAAAAASRLQLGMGHVAGLVCLFGWVEVDGGGGGFRSKPP